MIEAVYIIFTFFLGIMVGIHIESKETNRIQQMWRDNRELMREHFKQCAGLKP